MAINMVNPLTLQLQMHHQQMIYQQQRQMALHRYQQEEMPAGWPSMMNSPIVGPRLSEDVKVELENRKLWQQFHAETTEMIITKSGRRMFPAVQLSLQGLERRARYCVLLELAPASDRRHKYVGGVEAAGATKRGWTSAGPAEPQPQPERRMYVHPDSPSTGAHWMQHPLSFSKLKLTNNAVERHSNVLLTSMHKYIPKIWIIRCDDVANIRDLYNNPSACFTFKETEFIAVTAYQNENITKLKIDNNPFAKGFRESGQSSCKRKRQPRHEEPTSSSNSEISSHDEEEGNVSSSDSDHDLPSKRARLDPPQAQQQQQAPAPRLHRPWTDESEEVTRPTSCCAVEQRLVESLPPVLPQQYPDFLSMQHYHLMALELAKMSQIQQRFALAAAEIRNCRDGHDLNYRL